MINFRNQTARSIVFLLTISILFMSFKAPGGSVVTLNAMSRIGLETVSSVPSTTATAGTSIDFRVTHDVIAEGKVVIPAGSIAKGQVVRSDYARGLGKPGFVEVEIRSVTSVDGQEIYLTNSSLRKEGKDKSGTAIILGVLICILFLTMKGEDAVIPSGYQISASIASNYNIEVKE